MIFSKRFTRKVKRLEKTGGSAPTFPYKNEEEET